MVPMSHTSNPCLLYIVDATLNMSFNEMGEPMHRIYSIVQWYVNLWTRACANSIKAKRLTPCVHQMWLLPVSKCYCYHCAKMGVWM